MRSASGLVLALGLTGVVGAPGCSSDGGGGKDAASSGPDLQPIAFHRPPPRAEPAFGFDATSNRVVLFGGDDGAEVAATLVPSYHADTWIYDVATNAWSASAAMGPSARGRPAFAMDTTRRRLLMALGRFRPQSAGTHPTHYTLPDDTWAYDVAADRWDPLTPSGTPPGRAGAVAVYDATRDRLVMFGGNLGTAFNILDLSGFQPSAETWALTGGTAWQRVTTKGTAPSARYLAAAALDTFNHRMVVIGGCCDSTSGAFFSDAWALDLETDTWSKLAANGDGPTNRLGHSAVYLPEFNQVTIFGGHDDGSVGNVNDVWGIDSNGTWTQRQAGDAENNVALGCAGNATEQPYDFVTPQAGSPERRERQLFVATSNAALLAGGEGDCAQLDDTWQFVRGVWLKLIPAQHGESCLRRGDQCACLCQ